MKADAKTEMAIMAVLNKMAEGYARRNLDSVLSVFAPDPDVVMYGTGADEKRIGLAEIEAQAKRDWSQSESTALVYEWTAISAAGNVAWAAADVAFKATVGGQEYRMPGRLTAVFEKRGDQWLSVQSHFSFPAAGQEEGESFPG